MFSVRTKILIIALACVLACLGTFTIGTIETSRARLAESESQSLRRIYQSHNEALWVIQQGCEAILSSIAAREDVRDALQDQARERLLSLLQPTFADLHDTFSIGQLYVHDRDGTVLLRVHSPSERGDSYVSHRPLVLDALRQRRVTSGIELDSSGLGMRTVAPVLIGDQIVGLLEIGRNYDQAYLEDLRRRRDAEYRVWLTYDAAGLAGVWPTGREPASLTPELFYYASTFAGRRPLVRADYESVLRTRVPVIQVVQDEQSHFSTIAAPLLGYQGQLLGIIEISRSRQEALATFKSQLTATITWAVLVAVTGIMVLALFLSFGVLRPLQILTAAAKKQYEGDLLARVQHISSDEFGQLAATFNRLSNRLTDTLLKQRHTIEELARARQAAEQANASKDQFLATLSHELRTPLTPALLTAEALSQDASLPAEFKDDIQGIRRNVLLEARLIDDLLDLTRIARGKLELHVRDCEVHPLLSAAISVCQADIVGKQIAVHTDFAAKEDMVVADAGRLQQVFWNLIKNAVKFTGAGGVIEIVTSNHLDAAGQMQMGIDIRDSGIGMKAEILARIFNMFEQGDRAITRRFGGLGLGLAISKAIVDLHGGHITASSPGEGRGSVFSITLPTVVALPASPASTVPDAGMEPSPHALQILFVEDHGPTAKIVKRLLENMGHHPQLASDLASARHLAENNHFDLVISDLGLPDGHGTELIREMLKHRPVRGIAMSGFGMHEDVERSRAAGFTHHLTKPITEEQLRVAIAQAMASPLPSVAS